MGSINFNLFGILFNEYPEVDTVINVNMMLSGPLYLTSVYFNNV